MEFSKISIILVLYLSANLLALSRAQYSWSAGDDEDEYDEEAVEEVKVEAEKKAATSAPVTKAPAKARPTKAAASSSAAAAAVTAAAPSSSGSSAANNAAPVAPAPQPTTRRPRPTTSDDFDEDDEEEATTVNPIMNPLSKLFDSVAVGNVTGIVDHALSIRAPPPIRAMVNTIMSGIFNIGGLISNTVANTFGGAATPSPTAQKAVPTMTPLTQQQLLQAQLYQQQLIAQAYQQQLWQHQQAQQANLQAKPQPVDPLLKYVTDTRSAVAQAQIKSVKSDSEKVKSKVKTKTIPPKITGQSSPEATIDDDYNEIV